MTTLLAWAAGAALVAVGLGMLRARQRSGGSDAIRLVTSRYLGGRAEPLVSDDGYVDTGDIVELRDGRYIFVGRRGGVMIAIVLQLLLLARF